MNHRDANPAAMPARMPEGLSAKCSMLFVLPAEKLAKFLSSLGTIVRFIAANASQSKDNFGILI